MLVCGYVEMWIYVNGYLDMIIYVSEYMNIVNGLRFEVYISAAQ